MSPVRAETVNSYQGGVPSRNVLPPWPPLLRLIEGEEQTVARDRNSMAETPRQIRGARHTVQLYKAEKLVEQLLPRQKTVGSKAMDPTKNNPHVPSVVVLRLRGAGGTNSPTEEGNHRMLGWVLPSREVEKGRNRAGCRVDGGGRASRSENLVQVPGEEGQGRGERVATERHHVSHPVSPRPFILAKS